MLRELPSNSEFVNEVIRRVYHPNLGEDSLRNCIDSNPITTDREGIRTLSASIEDSALGDSGKGHLAQELNREMAEDHPDGVVFSLRYNGTANAGHEVMVGGEKIAMHQLPVAVTQEKATAIMGKGMLVHPSDLAAEIRYVSGKLGGALAGNLIIDANAVVTTDVHRAFEEIVNRRLGVGKGATGSGVAEGYASYYGKRALFVRDLISDDWEEKFRRHYKFYENLLKGLREDIELLNVNGLANDGLRKKHIVGSENEFIDNLCTARDEIKNYVSDVYDLLSEVWRDQKIPITFEGAQGGALDPYHGVYPDVTASRPLARVGIPDATEGIVMPEEIAFPVSVVKVPYMSSVGERVHPYNLPPDQVDLYRRENDEYGRSTGRPRGIYPLDIPLMRYIRRVAGYRYLALTHLDSARPDIPIVVVTSYVDKETGEEIPYRPYQWNWDRVKGITVELPSWDGKAVESVKKPCDLPEETKLFIAFLSRVLAPVAIATNGPRCGQMISWI